MLRSATFLNVPLLKEGALEIAVDPVDPELQTDFCDEFGIMPRSKHQVMSVQKSLCRIRHDVDKVGFDYMDRKLLEAIIDKFNGGPVG